MQIVDYNPKTEQFEMSRYIDLDVYHAVERSHPYYVEMVNEVQTQIGQYYSLKQNHLRVLELGAGTGLLTQDLVKHDYLEIDALEIDSGCVEILRGNVGTKANCIQGDAVTYCQKGAYDLVVSTFAHDHISYAKSGQFSSNIRKNLKAGGRYIMGGEILPAFASDGERKEALRAYHCFIVDKALREGHYLLAQIEINALKSGVDKVGDFKRHEQMFEDEMQKAGFRVVGKKKMGPPHLDNVGGVFVYVCEN